MIWSGEPEDIWAIAEALDTEQRFTWGITADELYVNETKFAVGEEIDLSRVVP